MPEENEDLENQELDESGTDTEDRGTGKDRPLSPRELVLAQMEERMAEERGEQLEPAAKASAVSKAKTDPGEGTEENTSVQDTLADLIEVKDGKQGMTLEVNGRKEWYPLENIRSAAMRSTAADERFNQAAQLRKDAANDLNAAKALKANAGTAATRTPDVAVDDATLDQVSLDLAQSLLNDSPEVIAGKLKTVLKTTTQARAPAVDAEAVADMAAKKVTTQLSEQDRQADLVSGLKEFEKQFPEMKAGTPLYAVADNMSDSVAAEHPEWTPSQVMLEAGRRAQAWAQGLSGTPTSATTRETPPAGKTVSNRETRKGTLVPMPKARSGTPTQSETLEESSPAAFMASLRKARGQPAA